MDITIAKLTISNQITEKTKELEALQTALALLENTFSASFSSLETAQAEVATLAEEKQKIVADLKIKEEAVKTITAEKETVIAEKEVLIKEKAVLQDQLDTPAVVETPTEVVADVPVEEIK
tara:strand:+ start:10322 stop:10684 length:363 start_codon:yes stop_codon:yes gene_type:complete